MTSGLAPGQERGDPSALVVDDDPHVRNLVAAVLGLAPTALPAGDRVIHLLRPRQPLPRLFRVNRNIDPAG